MPKNRKSADTESFSITLSVQAIEMIDSLIGVGIFGANRGEITRTLVNSRLEQLIAQKIVTPPGGGR